MEFEKVLSVKRVLLAAGFLFQGLGVYMIVIVVGRVVNLINSPITVLDLKLGLSETPLSIFWALLFFILGATAFVMSHVKLRPRVD